MEEQAQENLLLFLVFYWAGHDHSHFHFPSQRHLMAMVAAMVYDASCVETCETARS